MFVLGATSRTLDLVRSSGAAFTMTFKLGLDDRWMTSSTADHPVKTSVTHPTHFFEIDEHAATLASLQPLAYVSISENSTQPKKDSPAYWIVCNDKEARCFERKSNERVSKLEWKADIQHVELIEKGGAWRWSLLCRALYLKDILGHYALVAFTKGRELLSYSVPGLEFMHRVPLSDGPEQ